jgi:hypothetical protein
LNYARVLNLLQRGVYSLVLRPCGGWAILNARGRELVQSTCHRGYLWVRLYHNGARRMVPLHRIVWMVHHNRTVPRGRIIHHRHGKADNSIDSLELVTKGQHKKIHARRDHEALQEFLNS